MKIEDLLSLFPNILGYSIISVWRIFPEMELEGIPEKLKYEESDGLIYLQFSNDLIICFFAKSEGFTLQWEIVGNGVPVNSATNISTSDYWKSRLNIPVIDIRFLNGGATYPFGVSFLLKTNAEISLQYVSESEYTFDALIIR